MLLALSKGILCAVALLSICAVLVACSSNFMMTANYLINGDKNEIEYGELKGGIQSTTLAESYDLDRENGELGHQENSKHDHGLILLDVTQQNLASAYRRYGISSIGVIVLE